MTQDWVKLSALVATRPLGVRYSSMYSPSPSPHIPQVYPLIQSGILIWGRQQRVLALLPRWGFLCHMQNYLELPCITCNPFKSRKTSFKPWLAANKEMPWSFRVMRTVPEMYKAWVGTVFSVQTIRNSSFRQWIHGNDVDVWGEKNLWDAHMVDCWQGFPLHSPSPQRHSFFDKCQHHCKW